MFGRLNQKGRKMSFNKKVTNKFLIGTSIFLIIVNLLVPAAQAYAQNIETSSEVVSAHFNSELQCLAENVYYESSKESFEGKLAVAQVTMNRVDSGKFPSTVCGVVKQKSVINGVMVCQFSWFCNQAYIKLVRNPYQWEESLVVARKALTTAIAHDTLYHSRALYFHANYVNPNWNLTKVTQIGNHIFYKEKNRI
jgi:spore germination cell wall hydrolase CwlJ-like protein